MKSCLAIIIIFSAFHFGVDSYTTNPLPEDRFKQNKYNAGECQIVLFFLNYVIYFYELFRNGQIKSDYS